jgi:hypothetical protein
LQYPNSQSYRSKLPLDYNEIKYFLAIAQGQRISKECDKPLKYPKLIRKVSFFKSFIYLFIDFSQYKPEKFAIEFTKWKLILV